MVFWLSETTHRFWIILPPRMLGYMLVFHSMRWKTRLRSYKMKKHSLYKMWLVVDARQILEIASYWFSKEVYSMNFAYPTNIPTYIETTRLYMEWNYQPTSSNIHNPTTPCHSRNFNFHMWSHCFVWFIRLDGSKWWGVTKNHLNLNHQPLDPEKNPWS